MPGLTPQTTNGMVAAILGFANLLALALQAHDANQSYLGVRSMLGKTLCLGTGSGVPLHHYILYTIS